MLTGGHEHHFRRCRGAREDAHPHGRIASRPRPKWARKIIAGPLYSPVGYLPGRRRNADEWKWAVDCYQSLGPVLSRVQRDHRHRAAEPLRDLLPQHRRRRREAVRRDQPSRTSAFCSTPSTPTSRRRISPQGYRTVARHLKHVHTCENDRGIPGSGHVEWPGVFSGAARYQVRRLADHRELRIRARRALGRGRHLARPGVLTGSRSPSKA